MPASVLRRAPRFLLLAIALATACALLPDPRLRGVPRELRAEARAVLAESDPVVRAQAARRFARAHPREGLGFSIRLLEADASAGVRQRLTRTLGDRDDPEVRAALERRVLEDPSVAVAIEALRELQRAHADRLVGLIESRFAQDPPQGEADERALGEAHDHYLTLARGAFLPGFLRSAAEPIPVPTPANRVRVFAIGDFGTGASAQADVARAIRQRHAAARFDVGITLGDNFYPDGVHGPQDARFASDFAAHYAALRVPIFPVLGNHDWSHPDSPAAQVLHGAVGSNWHLPAARFSFRAGPAHFFGIDTTTLSHAALDWLRLSLDRSTAAWKVVYGHHPIRSNGAHGDSARLLRRLLPVLEGRAQLYVAGHDHDLQHLGPERGVHLVVAGGGGARVRPLRAPSQLASDAPVANFARATHGFAVLELSERALDLEFVGPDGASLYRARLEERDQPR